MQVSALTALAKTSGRAAARDVAAEATVVQGFLFLIYITIKHFFHSTGTTLLPLDESAQPFSRLDSTRINTLVNISLQTETNA